MPWLLIMPSDATERIASDNVAILDRISEAILILFPIKAMINAPPSGITIKNGRKFISYP